MTSKDDRGRSPDTRGVSVTNNYYGQGKADGNSKTAMGPTNQQHPNEAHQKEQTMNGKHEKTDSSDGSNESQPQATEADDVSSDEPGYDEPRYDGRSLRELIDESPTWQLVKGKRARPKAAHFEQQNTGYFRNGMLVRLWQPHNTRMHLRTFVVVKHEGECGSGLEVRWFEDLSNAQHHFKRVYMPIEVQEGSLQSNSARNRAASRRRIEEGKIVVEMMENHQELGENCWIKLDFPLELVFENYKYILCGWVMGEAWEYLWQEHRRVYGFQ